MRSRTTWTLLTGLVVALALAPVVSIGAAGRGVQFQTAVSLPADLQGALDGVPYRIRVPANWNGTLLVYAHGYNETPLTPTLVPQAAEEAVLLGEGYALAASRFAGSVAIPLNPSKQESGWTVKNAMQNIVALTTAFRDMVGHPQRTIMWGKSMGGVITLGVIEKFPGLFDGAVPLCASAGGAARLMDQRLDFTVAYAAAFPDWKDEWGTPGELRDDFNIINGVYAHAMSHLTEKGRWEFIRLVTGIPYDNSFYTQSFRLNVLWLSIVQRLDVDRRAGGHVAENRDRVYALTPEEKAYLLNTYGLNADPLLQTMNERYAIYSSDRNARNYAEHYVEPTGRITRPVLTLHTTGDAAATPDHEALYRKAVTTEGRADLLLQMFSNGNGTANTHCTFTSAQEIAAIHAMMDWLDKGIRPEPSSFPTDLGLVPIAVVFPQ